MSELWYPWYAADYKRDTYHLSLAEDGAYRRLIDEYMVNRGPLPADDISLARIIGVSVENWELVAQSVKQFFYTNSHGLLAHKRCDQELRRQHLIFERNSSRGRNAVYKRWLKNNGLHTNRILALTTLTLESKKDSKKDEEVAGEKNGSDVSPALASVLRAKGWSA